MRPECIASSARMMWMNNWPYVGVCVVFFLLAYCIRWHRFMRRALIATHMHTIYDKSGRQSRMCSDFHRVWLPPFSRRRLCPISSNTNKLHFERDCLFAIWLATTTTIIIVQSVRAIMCMSSHSVWFTTHSHGRTPKQLARRSSHVVKWFSAVFSASVISWLPSALCHRQLTWRSKSNLLWCIIFIDWIIYNESKKRNATSVAPQKRRQPNGINFELIFENFRCSKALGRDRENVTQLSRGKSFRQGLGHEAFGRRKFLRPNSFSDIQNRMPVDAVAWNKQRLPQIYWIIYHKLPFWAEKQFTGDNTTFSVDLLLSLFLHGTHKHATHIPLFRSTWLRVGSHSTTCLKPTSKENQTTHLMYFINVRRRTHHRYI